MPARAFGSLTSADLDKSVSAAGVQGTLASVRHYRIRTGPVAGLFTSLVVKVPTTQRNEPDHREVRGHCDDLAQVAS